MTLQEYQRGDPFTPRMTCSMVVGDNYHQCGRPGVARLIGPGKDEGRCELHARTNDAVIRNQPQRWEGWYLRWLDR